MSCTPFPASFPFGAIRPPEDYKPLEEGSARISLPLLSLLSLPPAKTDAGDAKRAPSRGESPCRPSAADFFVRAPVAPSTHAHALSCRVRRVSSDIAAPLALLARRSAAGRRMAVRPKKRAWVEARAALQPRWPSRVLGREGFSSGHCGTNSVAVGGARGAESAERARRVHIALSTQKTDFFFDVFLRLSCRTHINVIENPYMRLPLTSLILMGGKSAHLPQKPHRPTTKSNKGTIS